MSAAEVAELASDLGLAGIERQLELPPEITVDPASLPDDELAELTRFEGASEEEIVAATRFRY